MEIKNEQPIKMKNLFDNISEIKEQIEKAGGAILLLDFDGVLSAIAPTPDEAFISEENKALVRACALRFPTAIITGRELAQIKKKMDMKDEKNIFYIASHGLEWEEDGKDHAKTIPKETLEAINLAKEKIKPLMNRYPGMIYEDKSFMFATHYRIMNPELVDAFIKEVTLILEPIVEQHKLRLDHNLMTFELRPEIDWDKGDSVIFAEKHFNKKTGKKFMPIYIGDGLTDEDAFNVLKENGIAILVGETKTSTAKWYMHDQKEVGLFMKWLLSLEL